MKRAFGNYLTLKERIQLIVQRPEKVLILYASTTALSAWRILTFSFWKDDWYLLWVSLYHPSRFLSYWVHPGTPIEFFILTKLFGTDAILWQLTGLGIRVLLAFVVYLFIRQLTKSSGVGILSGLFIAAGYMGLDSISWPSGHVASIAAIITCLCVTNFLRYCQTSKKRTLIFSGLYLALGLLADPGRVFPIFIVLGFIFLHFWDKNITFPRLFERKTFLVFSICILAVLGFFLLWYQQFGTQSQLSSLVTAVYQEPSLFYSKIKTLGIYFASIGNLMIGWIIPIAEKPVDNTANYMKWISLIGLSLFLFSLYALFRYIRTKTYFWFTVGLLLLWIFVFYVPGWFVEQRAPMGGTQRYLVFSSIGLSAFIAYVSDRVRGGIFVISLIFIIFNIFTANRILLAQSDYRSVKIVDNYWNTIGGAVEKKPERNSFFFKGLEPVKSNALVLFGSFHYGVLRRIPDSGSLPIFLDDPTFNLGEYCQKNIKEEHIYGWVVQPRGRLFPVEQTEVEKTHSNLLAKCSQ